MEYGRHIWRFLASALAAALVVVPSASAKFDLSVVRVCGPAACGETREDAARDALRALFEPDPSELAAAPAIGPYYVIRGPRRDVYGVVVTGRTSVRWDAATTGTTWVRPSAELRGRLERLSRGLRPFASPRAVRAIVDGRVARNAAPFVRLLGELDPAPRPRASGPVWIPVTVIWNRPNPWTEASSMFYDPDDRAVYRGGRWYRVPPELRRLITR